MSDGKLRKSSLYPFPFLFCLSSPAMHTIRVDGPHSVTHLKTPHEYTGKYFLCAFKSTQVDYQLSV